MITNGLLTIERYLEWLRLNERAAAIYRGHPDTGWTLTPAAFRGSSVPSIKTVAQLRRWRSAAGRFANPMPRNNVEWLVLAQHYGIATPF
ncbi:FRG domain-containing protein [Sphingomonas aurantiaca]|uniref:FRG domain-containing protein n=1 Tax=Sphingomonas aurantiaca TaxID=185949 RepID=UPI003A5BAEB8